MTRSRADGGVIRQSLVLGGHPYSSMSPLAYPELIRQPETERWIHRLTPDLGAPTQNESAFGRLILLGALKFVVQSGKFLSRNLK